MHASRGTALIAIRGYRGGYLPAERREIEAGCARASVRGVVATNALELGIDIGAAGRRGAGGLSRARSPAPASRWAARAAGRASVGVLVAGAGAMDQYILMPTRSGCWRAARNTRGSTPTTRSSWRSHLTCAAAEMPFAKNEQFRSKLPGTAVDLLDDLVEAGQLYRSGGRYYWAGDGSPASAVSLRTASPNGSSSRPRMETAGHR